MDDNDKNFNFQANSNLFLQEHSDKSNNQANYNPAQPLAYNNSILDKFFMDSQVTTNNQEKIQNKYNTDDLLNKLFNDTFQSKSKNITKPNWFEDSVINTKPNNKAQENDIFGYLDEQSLFDDNHSIRPSLPNKDQKLGNDDKSSINLFADQIKPSNKMDINVDLDKMLMEINQNLESNANNLKTFNDNLLENIQKQDNIMNTSFNLLTTENNKDSIYNVNDIAKNKEVKEIYDTNKSPSIFKDESNLDGRKNIQNNSKKEVIKSPNVRADSIGNNSFNVLNKSNNTNVLDNSLKFKEEMNKSVLSKQSKVESNVIKEDNNKLNLTKLSKNDNILKDELNFSKVSKISKKETFVKEELDKSNFSKISKNDNISNKINNLKNDFSYNLQDAIQRKDTERNEVQHNSYFSQNKGTDLFDEKQESFHKQKEPNKLLDNELEYFFSERQPQRAKNILEENNLNILPIDAMSQRNNTVNSNTKGQNEAVHVNKLDNQMEIQSRTPSVQRLNYTTVNQSQNKLTENEILNNTLNEKRNMNNENIIKVNKEKIVLANDNLDDSRRQDNRLSKILENSIRESNNILKSNRDNTFPVVNYFEASKNIDNNKEINLIEKENLVLQEHSYKNEEDFTKQNQSKKEDEPFNIENYDLKSYKEEIHEDIPEIKEEVLDKPEEQRFLSNNNQKPVNTIPNESIRESSINDEHKKEIVLYEKDNVMKPEINIATNNLIETKNNNNSNRFSFFNQFQEQSNPNSNRKRGDNNYFEDFNMSGNDITNKINADQAIFEGIDNNLSSRNNRLSNNPIGKEENNKDFSNTGKYVGFETNDLAMSIGRQSQKKFLSSAKDNHFKPFIPKDEDVNEIQLQSIENVHDEFPVEKFKEKESDNNFHLSDHHDDEKEVIVNKNDDNLKKNSYFSAFPDEKHFNSNLRFDSNNKSALNNEKNSQKDIDFDAIYINFHQEGKETEKPVSDKAEKYREKEPESVAVMPQTSHHKSYFDDKAVSEAEALVTPDKPKKDKTTTPQEPKKEKKEAPEKEKVEKKNDIENNKIPAEKKENIIYLKKENGEKYYGKITIGKDDEKNLKFKKDLIFTDTFFTILNNRKVQIKFNEMPPYFDQPEEVYSDEIKKLLDSLLKDPEYNDTKIKLESFNLSTNKQMSNHYVYNMNDLSYFGGLSKCEEPISKIFETFEKIAVFEADGNGFYRVFMFSLLEYYIITSKINELVQIINDFNQIIEYKFKRYNSVVNKKQCLIIFKIILEHLAKEEITKAYEVFCKALVLFPNFDSAIIKYMRLAIGKFLDLNKESIYNMDNYLVIDFLLHPAYKKGRMYNMTGFIEESIFSMQNEAEQIVYYLAPIVFNINLELFVLEGINSNDPEKSRFLNEIMYCQDENNREKVTILYRFTHFDILYSKPWYESNKDIIDVIKTTEISESKSLINQGSSNKCESCEKDCPSVEFSNKTILSFCLECLLAVIKQRLTERIKNFIAEEYNNFEFYCRPLSLNEDREIKDEEFLIITGKTITQYLISIIEGLCESCIKETNISDFKLLECNCSVCRTCLIRKIKLATDDVVFYNTYEQKIVKLKTIACFCYNEFDYRNAIEQFKIEELKEFIDESNVRLSQQVQMICMNCEINLQKDINCKTQYTTYFTVEIQEEPNKVSANHVLCKKCFKSLKGYGLNKIKCELCDTNHTVLPNFWKKKIVEKKCHCDCTIF